MTRFVGVVGSKGGVGKTTMALNLGAALVGFGRHCIVVDANISSPNVGLFLGSSNLPGTLHDVLKGDKTIKEVAYSHPSGLKIIPGSINVEDSVLDSDKLSNTLRDLEGCAEIVLVDTGSCLNCLSGVLDAVDSVLIISTAYTASIAEVMKTKTFVEKQGKKVLGVLLNNVRGSRTELNIQNIQSLTGLPVIGTVPFSVDVIHSVALKHPVLYSHPNSEVIPVLKEVASFLIGQQYKTGHTSFKDLLKMRFGLHGP